MPRLFKTSCRRKSKWDPPLAELHCPTKAHVASGISYSEIPEKAKGCPGMAPQNQTQEVVA